MPLFTFGGLGLGLNCYFGFVLGLGLKNLVLFTSLIISRNNSLSHDLLITACDFARRYRLVVTLVYYGLSLSAGQLDGNFYVNNFIIGLVEIPAYTSCFFAMQK